MTHCRSRRSLLAALAALPWTGCSTWLDTSPKDSPLTPLALGKQLIGLDIFFVRFAAVEGEPEQSVWHDLDEQAIPTAQRDRLAANGLRAGVAGTQLPLPLEQLLHLTDRPAGDETRVAGEQLATDAPVRQRYVQSLAGRRTHIICTGESQRHDALSVLVRHPDGSVDGRTYRKALGIFAARAFPESDGRVRLELIPEIEHGDPQRRFESSEGMLRVDYSPDRARFDSLRIDATLRLGGMLVIGSHAERGGTLGHQFFLEPSGDQRMQKLLLVRPTLAPRDELFDPPAALPERSARS